ncbi:DUF2975 domain-containing protein [Geobacillus zalihae]|uniref:DUF2975 domain-containing protein n=1 Tax=Geobacillus zalihae TaxID=213419 RepID=UPI0009BD3B2F|nr:DUF2975 domain-containing protein [Geobacillus zalihae]OQP16129.1 hypothetical protein B1693_10200 [Geobacillus zalihae]QNU23806.1 DUF2975 domain-containing protein [Geobacillus zalihae]
MKRETLFLKASLVLIGLPVLALCVFLVPALAKVAVKLVPAFPWIKYFVYVVFEASALPFYFALYQAFRLLVYIDRNDAFSEASVKALKTIKHCAVAISGLHLLALPLFYLFAEKGDAPGVIFVGLIVPFASLVIAVFAAVLQKLLQQAIEIKQENELTV